ncbi:MAG TPA: hypothetical protein VLM79_32985 [Kofleriaceae bacterium]|nr:hypothetical protein [Kofleriaceae bacterium]
MGVVVIEDHSLRERFQRGGEVAHDARVALDSYFRLLDDVFPICGEIETVAAYDAYLRDPSMEWDIVMLTDASNGRIIGGIQWQPLRNVAASWIDALAWVEHVWLADEPGVRSYPSFRHLLATVRKHMCQQRVDVGFMEFNDPQKMMPEEMEQDAVGGLSTSDRLLLWARMGLCELVHWTVDRRRMTVPYAQPAMEGGPPVRMLSLGFFALTQELTGVRLSAEDYLQILYRAHSTIRTVDPSTDPTCLEYTAAVNMLHPASFEFAPLKQRIAADVGKRTPRRRRGRGD